MERKGKRLNCWSFAKNAAEMKVPKVDEEIELKDDVIKSKITLPGGKLLLNPLSLRFWTHNFTNIPDFRFPHIYHYVLVKMSMMRLVYGRIKAFEVFALYTWKVTLCFAHRRFRNSNDVQ